MLGLQGEARARGAGSRQTTRQGRRKRPAKASQPSTMEAAARRRGSPRNRYAAVAKVRWPLRAARSAAEADAPCPARPSAAPRHHTCCVFIARQSRGCRDACHGRRHLATSMRYARSARSPIVSSPSRSLRWVTPDCLFVTMNTKIARHSLGILLVLGARLAMCHRRAQYGYKYVSLRRGPFEYALYNACFIYDS